MLIKQCIALALALILTDCSREVATSLRAPGGAACEQRLPIIALYADAPDGVGDLVHLEEYIKYIRNNFEGMVSAIGIARIAKSNQPALNRSTRLAADYASLNIRTFEGTPPAQLVSLVELDNIYRKIKVSASKINWHFGRTATVNVETPEDTLLEYGAGGNFRFYSTPGQADAEATAKFHESLKREGAELYDALFPGGIQSRPFFPGDFKNQESLELFIDNLAPEFKPCDFYVPHKLLTADFKQTIMAVYPSTAFISPEIHEGPRDAEIRIFSGFPLSDTTYRGLYLYTDGEIVGYAGDDTFTFALSSGKLPFPGLPTNGVQEDVITKYGSQFLAIFRSAQVVVVNQVVRDYLMHVRDSYTESNSFGFGALGFSAAQFSVLKKNWLDFALDAYHYKNAFRQIDQIVAKVREEYSKGCA